MPANNYFTEPEFNTAYDNFKCCYGKKMATFSAKQISGTSLSASDRDSINTLKAMEYVFSTYDYSGTNLLTDKEVYAVMNNASRICICI